MLREGIKKEEDKLIVALEGDLDVYSEDSFKKFVVENLDGEDLDLVFDFKDLDYLDSTGLGLFINIYKDRTEKGRKVYIINCKPNIYKLFKITDLTGLFNMED